MEVLTKEDIDQGALKDIELGLTIGNFDGVHLGHQNLLSSIKEKCLKENSKFLVITFVPHPMKVIKGKEHFLISSYKKRRELLEQCGVDFLLELKFTRDFSTLSPEEFLKEYIFSMPQIKSINLGYDFTFGSNKEGGHKLVAKECEKKGIEFSIQEVFKEEAEIVSSSLIRDELKNRNIEKVEKMLGRCFKVEGSVVKGEGRGRQIGFPTANISMFPDQLLPKKGVYITRTGYKDLSYFSVTNIGVNPTFTDKEQLSVETHILDFDNDIYGENIEICFLKCLRDEKKFSSVNELVEQIQKDVETARKYFQNEKK